MIASRAQERAAQVHREDLASTSTAWTGRMDAIRLEQMLDPPASRAMIVKPDGYPA